MMNFDSASIRPLRTKSPVSPREGLVLTTGCSGRSVTAGRFIPIYGAVVRLRWPTAMRSEYSRSAGGGRRNQLFRDGSEQPDMRSWSRFGHRKQRSISTTASPHNSRFPFQRGKDKKQSERFKETTGKSARTKRRRV